MEDIVLVVLDTLIDEDAEIIRVALKDIEIIGEAEQTEPNSSEKPNNCEPQTEEHCETCRHKDECEGATYEYKNTEWWCLAYAPIDEPQTDCAWK